jgi:hypothetical protein
MSPDSVSRELRRTSRDILIGVVATAIVDERNSRPPGIRPNSTRTAEAVVRALEESGYLELDRATDGMVPVPPDQVPVSGLCAHGLRPRDLRALHRNGVFTLPILELALAAIGDTRDLGPVLPYCGPAITDSILMALASWRAENMR